MRSHTSAYGAEAVVKLRDLLAETKEGDPLATVTIIVRDNIAAISVRRSLARGVGKRSGVAAINVTTLRRLAEQIIAASGDTKPPISSALLTALWRRELTNDPGSFAPVADHPATVRALVRAHRELRELDARQLDAVAASSTLAADLVRLHRSVAAHSLDGRRDEVAVLQAAAERVQSDGMPAELGAIVVHLPEEPTASEVEFATVLDAASEIMVVMGITGDAEVDSALVERFTSVEGVSSAFARSTTGNAARSATETPAIADRILHASDSDDEVRAIVREVRTLLAGGAKAHRIAVLHPVAVPYARLMHDRLQAAGIRANGPGVRPLRDRAIADSFLTLLALDPDDLQRGAVFDWLGRAPIRLGEGQTAVPRTSWERLSREAGITGGDWAGRLADHEARNQARLDADRDNPEASDRSIAFRERSIAETQELSTFIAELRHRLEEGRMATGWAMLGEWALALLHRYIGRSDAMSRLPEDEQRAATAIENTLGAIAELDGIGGAPTLAQLLEILEVDLDARKPRVGRFGEGVFVGPISSAPSLDVDHVFVVGLAENLYPGRSGIDPLLPDTVRALTDGNLKTSRDRLRQQHRAILAAFTAGTHVTASFPRGDLRRGGERLPSRWLMPTLRTLSDRPELEATCWAEASSPLIHSVASHWEGVARSDRPATAQEWRLRRLAGHESLQDDAVLDDALAVIDARRGDEFTRFDGNLHGVAGLLDYAAGEALIAPTTLERYAGCPHAFFVERMLNVRPLETPEEIITIRPWDLGSIVHEVMDRLTTESDDLPGFGEPWEPAHRERMRAIAEEVMDDFERRGLTGHPRLWQREREQLRLDFELILDLDDEAHAKRDSRIIASELPFGMHGRPAVRLKVAGGTIAMRGSADRVDQTRDGTLLVTDFKTGSARGFKDIRKDPVAAGQKLQLPLYAHAALAAFDSESVEAGYWFIGRRDRGERVEVQLDERLDATYRAALCTLSTGIREGRFIARPPKDNDFAWVQCAYCNPDGVGYGHVRTASERKRTDRALGDLYSLLDPSVLQPEPPHGEETQ